VGVTKDSQIFSTRPQPCSATLALILKGMLQPSDPGVVVNADSAAPEGIVVQALLVHGVSVIERTEDLKPVLLDLGEKAPLIVLEDADLDAAVNAAAFGAFANQAQVHMSTERTIIDESPGVINVIANAPADAEKIVGALIAYPAMRRINFTGSTKTARIIAETATRYSGDRLCR
jgi:acyl-CoA reductase-like NAD-dependent aldehyde dehydrogenase